MASSSLDRGFEFFRSWVRVQVVSSQRLQICYLLLLR